MSQRITIEFTEFEIKSFLMNRGLITNYPRESFTQINLNAADRVNTKLREAWLQSQHKKEESISSRSK